jgi:hypothetical protein
MNSSPIPTDKPRDGWELAAIEMAEAGDDELLFDDVFEDEDCCEQLED